MKRIAFILLTILLAFNGPAFAKETSTINGSSDLNGKYASLEINGSLTFKDLEVSESLVINGSIHGKNLTCKTMETNGSCDVENLQAQSIESNGSFVGKGI